jgi:hypothetical protein
VLRPGERAEPEAALGHAARVALELALPPDHGTRDHLSGEAQRPEGRREFDAARPPGLQEVEVLDPGAGSG